MAEKFKRTDGRKNDELRKIKAKVGIIPNADGSAMYQSGDTIAIAAVYGPRKMHPQHQQDPEKGVLRCNYNMLSFSVSERIRPGPSRRSTEISKITEWALEPVLMIEKYPNSVNYDSKKDMDEKFYKPLFMNTYNGLQNGGHYIINVCKEVYDKVLKELLGEAHESFPLKKSKRQNDYTEMVYVWKKL